MRLGVLDVGSNSAQLRVVDLIPDLPPETVRVVKHLVRLAEATDRHGVISQIAVDRLVHAVRQAAAAAQGADAEELIAFATSAIRDAPNGGEIIAEIQAATDVTLRFMDGEVEARLTFLAARGWCGWSAGPLLLADIGGGSMELAYGPGRYPEIALSLPLGAARLTRHHLPHQVPVKKKHRRALHDHVHSVVAHAVTELEKRPRPITAVATSKTFAQLARLCGAPKAKKGLHARRILHRDDLDEYIPELARRTDAERAELRGVKSSRAHQILAGAIVAHATMEVLKLNSLTICPWAIREGVMLHRLENQPVPPEPMASPAKRFVSAVGRSPLRTEPDQHPPRHLQAVPAKGPV
ncbi:hypothetical protein E1264_20115 [Actinomadura sp. KC216]|uniref:Ppx/GppA phosphatase family protein n=1 Tax=Actinomadura sp. KC216 TaxID=2530370 RepID=UPI0010512BC2|nr:hypothetical protein [Actinomadura sp. KC216]TDB85781.1 hypothetical protein E1264_20115 [Actinomadura sp. KC216]